MKIPVLIATIVIATQHELLLLVNPSPNPLAECFLKCLQSNKFESPPNHPISKALYTPQNESFLETLQFLIRNARFNRSTTPKPLALIAATHYSHVQSTVLCARVSGIELRIRSGGHDYEGMSYVSHVPFVVLDMFNLRKVEVDVENKVAWVEAGAIFGELYYDIAIKSNNTLAFPAGVCFTVGAGGHISGGGYGVLMRKYGLSVDNVIDALVVDAKSRMLSRFTMGEDLFWAIRGGGASSFAVVLSWKLRLVEVPQTVTVFKVTKTLEQRATNIVYQWQHVLYNMTPNLFLRVQPQALASSKGNNNTLGVSFDAFYLGGAEELVDVVNKILPLLGLEEKDCIEMSWAQSIIFWDRSNLPYLVDPKGIPLEEMLQRTSNPHYQYNKNKSDYVKKPISKKGLKAIWKKMIELGPSVFMQFTPYGGRMSEIAEDATPFPHRAGNLFKIQYISTWEDASVEVEKKAIEGIWELHKMCSRYVSKNPRETFWNYRDFDIGTNANGSLGFAFDYFKGNVKRLVKVKTHVDPNNVFRNEQSILVDDKVYLKDKM